MSKELEALNKIQHDFGQLKGQELVSCYETIFNALKRLEAIDNANPSEALECLERIEAITKAYSIDLVSEFALDLDTIKQALLKAQEPKHYLKWEDLGFNEKAIYKRVTLNGELYLLKTYRNFILDFDVVELEKTDGTILFHINQHNLQFFNDLHLEVLE